MLSRHDADDASSTSSSTASYGQVIRRNSLPVVTLPITDHSNLEAPPPQRTLSDVREQAAQSLAVRTLRKVENVDGSKVGVAFALSHAFDERFLRLVMWSLKRALLMQDYLFALAVPGAGPESTTPLVLFGSSDDFVHRASLLVRSKFLSRVGRVDEDSPRLQWTAGVRDFASSSYDEVALWDVVRKAAREPVDPLVPPPGSRSIAQILTHARARLERITPREAYDELLDAASPWPVVLVDIRPEAQRRAHGEIDGALVVERNVLEWRFDPRCAHRLPIANRYDLRVVVFCQEGYTSSLAAASLRDLGILNATDIIGGYALWKEAGLPVRMNDED
ncbi:Rhodanese-like protein [Amylocystis lapponica]|nr:Rhodanese-like protein [Amylocystis lapponica]